MNQSHCDFFREVLSRYSNYRQKHRMATGAEPVVPPVASKQLSLTKELLSRYVKFGTKAECTELEIVQVQQLANWLVNQWHRMHGSEDVPQMVFTDSGAGWMREGQV